MTSLAVRPRRAELLRDSSLGLLKVATDNASHRLNSKSNESEGDAGILLSALRPSVVVTTFKYGVIYFSGYEIVPLSSCNLYRGVYFRGTNPHFVFTV